MTVILNFYNLSIIMLPKLFKRYLYMLYFQSIFFADFFKLKYIELSPKINWNINYVQINTSVNIIIYSLLPKKVCLLLS